MIVIASSVRRPGVSVSDVRRIVSAVLIRIGRRSAQVSVHFVGDRRIRTLNQRHRGKDAPTDVLSFATEAGDDLGDVFLAVPYIERQARYYHISYCEEAARMLIHGVLHVAGYDHIGEREAKKMFGLQEEILINLKIKDQSPPSGGIPLKAGKSK